MLKTASLSDLIAYFEERSEVIFPVVYIFDVLALFSTVVIQCNLSMRHEICEL